MKALDHAGNEDPLKEQSSKEAHRGDVRTREFEESSLRIPKSYARFVRYSEPGYTSAEPLASVGSTFEAAMHVFKMFFGLKTMSPWEDRFLSAKMDPHAFMYRLPGKGEAVGVTDRTDMLRLDGSSVGGRWVIGVSWVS